MPHARVHIINYADILQNHERSAEVFVLAKLAVVNIRFWGILVDRTIKIID